MNSTTGKPFARKTRCVGGKENEFVQAFQPVYRKSPEMESNPSDDTFHVAISPIATFVQFLGLMPVCGVSQKNPKKLEFKWKSFRIVFTLMYITYGIVISSIFFISINEEGISAKNIGNDHELVRALQCM